MTSPLFQDLTLIHLLHNLNRITSSNAMRTGLQHPYHIICSLYPPTRLNLTTPPTHISRLLHKRNMVNRSPATPPRTRLDEIRTSHAANDRRIEQLILGQNG
jgi:hypothetical protein